MGVAWPVTVGVRQRGRMAGVRRTMVLRAGLVGRLFGGRVGAIAVGGVRCHGGGAGMTWMGVVLLAVMGSSGCAVSGRVAARLRALDVRPVTRHDESDGEEWAHDDVSSLVSAIRSRLVSGMPEGRALDLAEGLPCGGLSFEGLSCRMRGSASCRHRGAGSFRSRRFHWEDARYVARALDAIVRVCSVTGAPMVPCLDVLLRDLSIRGAARDAVESALAVPRATAGLLAALPVLTIMLCEMAGLRIVGFLTSGPPGWLCLGSGLILYIVGLLWMRALMRACGDGAGRLLGRGA